MISIVNALKEARISYAICGGLALSIHGYPRFTKDIDLLILPRNIAKAKKTVRKVGFVVEAMPMTFRAGTDAETRVHRISKFIGEDHLMFGYDRSRSEFEVRVERPHNL